MGMRNKRKQAQKMAAGLVAISLLMSSPAYAAEPTTPGSQTGATTTTGTTTTGTTTTGNTTTGTTTGNTTAGATTTSTSPQGASNTAVTGSDASKSFTDVSPQHWAIKHITKLSALSIVQGYEKNEFRPDISVSQQDVIIMAIRMMGLESEALKNKADTVMAIAVDNYAKQYVALAFDRGLITTTEEAESTGGAGTAASKQAWGSRPATREWVAKLVIRAINKQDVAQKQTATPSSFNDAKDFSSWAVGYVNAAVSLKIVNGMDGNEFQPKGAVTRAQMATFLSRADKELTTRSNKVAVGYLMELKDRKLTIQNDRGQSSEFTLSSDTVIYNAKDDSRIPSTQLKETNEVYVIQTQGTATYIELTNDQERMGSLEGNLSKLYLNQMQIAVGEELKQLAPNVTVTDKDGRGLSLGSLPVGSSVELKWNLLVPNAKITQIIVKQVPISKTAEGSVVSIQKDQNTVTFLEQSTGQNETYPLAALVPVKLADGTLSEIGKLSVGDDVSYEIKANQLVGLTIRKQADVSNAVQGSLSNLSDDKKSMTVNINGKSLEAYFIADNAIVVIDGLSNAGFFDLATGDELKLELLNEKIVKVTVTSRSIEQMAFATIINYDADTKLLTGTFENGDPFAYKLTDSTALKVVDSTIPLTNFSNKFEKGDKIDLTVSKNKVITVSLTTRLEGTLTQLNTTSNEVSIRTVSAQNLTFKVPQGVGVAIWTKSNATLSDLKVGDNVIAMLNGDQDTIVQISPTRTAVYKTLAANADTRQINTKDEAGALFTFNIENDNKIINPAKTTARFEDILQDEYIKVTYVGNTVDKVTVLNTIRGKVTGVDTSAGTVTVQDYFSGVQVVPVGKQFVIKQNGTTAAALTSLKPNDRVEIIKDSSDKTIISVAGASKRTVSNYDNLLNQLVFKPAAQNDKTAFNFFAKAYLHKGTQKVAANEFTDNEEVTIYVLEDKIVEIEK